MAQQITISIQSSDTHPDILTVQDAMEQILDFFSLIQSEGEVVWRLVTMSMNSPLQATAEATAFVPGVDYESIARSQKSTFSSRYASLISGNVPMEWAEGQQSHAIKRFLKRNTNGIGKIVLDFHGDFNVIQIVPAVAESSLKAIEKVTVKPILTVEDKDCSHAEFGSVDAALVEVGTHYNQPAILVRERITQNDIWCIVPQELHTSLSAHTKLSDVWMRRRITVRGKIKYDRNNIISRIEAADIELHDERLVSLESVMDEDFSHGLTTAEYLNLLRG